MDRDKIITTVFIQHLWSQFIFHRQRIREFCKLPNHQHHKCVRKYSDCQLKFRLALVSGYSKHIAIALIVKISLRFIFQIFQKINGLKHSTTFRQCR